MDQAGTTELETLRRRLAAAEDDAPRREEHPLASIHGLVLDSMSEGVNVTDETGIIVYTNAAEDRMFGYQRGELVGQHVTVLNAYPTEVNERIVADVIAQLRSIGQWKGEWLNRRKDGTPFQTAARITALSDGGKSYWVAVQEDITDRRRAETDLRDTNEQLHALIHASPLPIVAFGRDGLIRLWNAAAERVFGWTEAEVLGKQLPFIPEDKASEHRKMRERDLAGVGFTNREVRRRRKDGSPIDISVSTAPMLDASGQVTGIMSVYVDVTEQKRFAEEQRRSMEMLQEIERQLTLLVEASSVLLSSPGSEQVVGRILDLAQRFIQAEAYAVWRKREKAWHLVAATGLSDSFERTSSLGRSIEAQISQQPFAVEDVYSEPLLAYRSELYRSEGIVALLSVPLRMHGELGGTIAFYYRAAHRFSDAEMRVASALGNLAASGLSAAEIYERQADLRAAAEAAERRASFLAAVGAELGSSLEYEVTLAGVAKLAVPNFADWCSVDVVQHDGTIRRLAVQHVDPAKIEFAYEFSRRYPAREGDLLQLVLRTGNPILMSDVPDSLLVEKARDPEHLALVRTLGIRSIICAPMVARGRTLGLLTFVSSESGRRFQETDLGMATEIARRAAVAVDNASLFTEVRNSEERFRRLYDSNILGVAFWKIDGVVTSANDAYLHVLGISREKLEREGGLVWEELTPGEYKATDKQVIQECLEYGVSRVHEKEYLRADGTRAAVLLAAAFLSEQQKEGVAFLVDITERKKLDRQFRGLADAAVAINAARSQEQVLRAVGDWLEVLVPTHHPKIALAEIALGSMATSSSGEEVTVALKGRLGNIIGLIRLQPKDGAGLTDNDRAVVVQLAEMASIAIENTALNESLRRSNEELERANEDLNQFAYSASHDLQEPLRMISIYTQLLARRIGDTQDGETLECMRFTLEGAKRMELLIRDLLAYTQAVNIRDVPDECVDSGAALRTALANLRGAIESTGAEVRFDEMPMVRAYTIHLVQLFQNLIGNAIKYRGSEPPHIDVTVVPESNTGRWKFSVQDNGIGIAPKYHQQVFGLFKRLYSAHQYPGTGIGLAICQKVVERYGGGISVESEEGRGARFVFTLPQ